MDVNLQWLNLSTMVYTDWSEVFVPLNIKNAEVERLVNEVAAITGETKTEAVRRSLAERRERLALRLVSDDRGVRLRRFLEEEVWPLVPDDEHSRRWTRAEEDALLGYGPEGT